jgi:uncharacterized Zn finger protein (UPF0148 family)
MGDFDKEAERRKLREKYERDEKRREETQRMSELLLQGATMTNRHCDNCGAPIFRYEGQEFCPNCQGGDAAAEVADAADEAAAEVAGGETGETADGAADGTAADDGAVPADAGASQRPDAPRQPAARQAEPTRYSASSEQTDAPSADGEVRRPPTAADSEAAAQPPAGGDEASAEGTAARSADLTAARASLVRALTEHARQAESTADPRRAREHLSAAREAAEAIAALDR